MGLFHKKEACPVCGGEVKGLFHKKIGGKKALCKDCSAQVSMAKELLKDATPELHSKYIFSPDIYPNLCRNSRDILQITYEGSALYNSF